MTEAGSVTFKWAGGKATAVLDMDTAQWSVSGEFMSADSAKMMTESLQLICNPQMLDGGPAHGPWGTDAVLAAAKHLKGDPSFPPPGDGDDDENTVY